MMINEKEEIINAFSEDWKSAPAKCSEFIHYRWCQNKNQCSLNGFLLLGQKFPFSIEKL